MELCVLRKCVELHHLWQQWVFEEMNIVWSDCLLVVDVYPSLWLTLGVENRELSGGGLHRLCSS